MVASDLLRREERDDEWESVLYYPLKSARLDDVTRLFMLRNNYRMAEREANTHRFSKEEKDAYLKVLDVYINEVLDRAENETVTRTADYIPLDFSDPVHVKSYLDRLKDEWSRL